MGGSPAIIDIRQARGGAGDASVLLQLDEAARSRQGHVLRAAAHRHDAASRRPCRSAGAASTQPRVEIDLSRAAIDNLLPGWIKPAGRPAKVSFNLHEERGQELRDFVLDSGPVQLRGQVQLSAEGALERAELSSLKLSPGDDLQAQVDRSGGALPGVALRGNVGDARPAHALPHQPWRAGSSGAKDARVAGHRPRPGGQHPDRAQRGGPHQRLAPRSACARATCASSSCPGRLRGAAVAAQLAVRERGAPTLNVQSQDAGATLRFLDIYKRMVGRRPRASRSHGRRAPGGQHDDRRLRAAGRAGAAPHHPGPAGRRRSRAATPASRRSTPRRSSFTALKVSFNRTATKLEFRDAAIWGPSVGFKLDGWIDFGRDRADIAGTFVPAYGARTTCSRRCRCSGRCSAAGRTRGCSRSPSASPASPARRR